MKIPRIVLAGTHSGVGKTTLATGLMAALKQRERPIQGYKVGPDYIDPSYHAAATGRASRNLDRWLLGENLPSVFAQSAKERWAVIEGVMGMYDGMSGTAGFGSTADVAKLLDAPIVLIVDASSMSRSVAALVHGFSSYDLQVKLQGVILNRVKSSAQETILREALSEIKIPVLGVLPKELSLKLPERHLGLVPVGEGGLLEGFIETLSDLVTKHVDLDQVESIMLGAPEFNESISFEETKKTTTCSACNSSIDFPIDNANLNSNAIPSSDTAKQDQNDKFRLGLAWDEAFLFYYQDALDLAKCLNSIIIPFSPLHDQSIPEDLDGIIIGGGFPELHLNRLSENTSFLDSLRAYAASGKPIYAECGGYMYLGKSIKDFEGNELPMAGLIPMKAEMTKRLQGIGYRKGVFREDNFLGPRGTAVQGHEFHYSRVVYDKEYPPAYELFRGDMVDRLEGYAQDNIVASYLHLHFSGHQELLEHWFASRSGRVGGMITIYTGQGKGKTTSALGEALLAYSEGKRVLMVQFLKGSTYSGELIGLNRLGIPLIQFGVGCRWSGMIRTGMKHCTGCGECFRQNRNPEIAVKLVQQAIDFVSGEIRANIYQVIILDEISHALNHGFLDLNQLRELLSAESSRQIHWILTGRGMPADLGTLADNWWDLNMLKHPFSKGIKSRRGIEY